MCVPQVREQMDSGGTFGQAYRMLRAGMYRRKDKPFEAEDARRIYVHSVMFKGGTRLRDDPTKPGEFKTKVGRPEEYVVVVNGDEVRILALRTVLAPLHGHDRLEGREYGQEIEIPYARVQKVDEPSVQGWILQRNLTFVKGHPGTLGHFKDRAQPTQSPAVWSVGRLAAWAARAKAAAEVAPQQDEPPAAPRHGE